MQESFAILDRSTTEWFSWTSMALALKGVADAVRAAGVQAGSRHTGGRRRQPGNRLRGAATLR